MLVSIITDQGRLLNSVPSRNAHRQNHSLDPVERVALLPLPTSLQNTCGIAFGLRLDFHFEPWPSTIYPHTLLLLFRPSSLLLFQHRRRYRAGRLRLERYLHLLLTEPRLLSGYLLAPRPPSMARLVTNSKRSRPRSILATTRPVRPLCDLRNV